MLGHTRVDRQFGVDAVQNVLLDLHYILLLRGKTSQHFILPWLLRSRWDRGAGGGRRALRARPRRVVPARRSGRHVLHGIPTLPVLV